MREGRRSAVETLSRDVIGNGFGGKQIDEIVGSGDGFRPKFVQKPRFKKKCTSEIKDMTVLALR